MVSSSRRLLLTLTAALWMAAPTAAQTSDPTQLEKLLKTGDTVTIVDASGSETRAQVVGIADGMLEFHPITPGDSSNAYLVGSDVKTFPLDQIAGLNRTDVFGALREPLYQRRDSFASLHQRLKPGQVIRITQTSGDETVGRVTEVSPTSLVILTKKTNPRDGSGRPRYEWDGARTFAPSTVEKITRESHIWDGALKGAVIALASMLIVTHDCYGCDGIGYFYALSMGIGAGVGLGIDAAIPARTIYRARR
jgi:hypothetical protein